MLCKSHLNKNKFRVCCQCPTRNAEGSPSGRNERTMGNNLNPQEKIKNTSKGN